MDFYYIFIKLLWSKNEFLAIICLTSYIYMRHTIIVCRVNTISPSCDVADVYIGDQTKTARGKLYLTI